CRIFEALSLVANLGQFAAPYQARDKTFELEQRPRGPFLPRQHRHGHAPFFSNQTASRSARRPPPRCHREQQPVEWRIQQNGNLVWHSALSQPPPTDIGASTV